MIRDKRKHKDTDGWGYALFNEKGLTFPEDPQVQVRACAACHKIVPDRGFVFSQKMALSILEKHPKNIFNGPSRIKFKSIKRSQAPALMLNLIASNDTKIDIVAGKLADNIFQGALDEIRPILSERTWAKKRPAALLSPDGKKFSLTVLSTNGSLCGDKPEMTSYMTTLDEKEPVRKLTFCYEKSK